MNLIKFRVFINPSFNSATITLACKHPQFEVTRHLQHPMPPHTNLATQPRLTSIRRHKNLLLHILSHFFYLPQIYISSHRKFFSLTDYPLFLTEPTELTEDVLLRSPSNHNITLRIDLTISSVLKLTNKPTRFFVILKYVSNCFK